MQNAKKPFRSDTQQARPEKSNETSDFSGKSNRNNHLLTPLWTTIIGFSIFMVVAFIYSLYNPDLYWPGLILMFIMYGVIYFIGARAAASKKGKSDDMLVAGRSMPLWISMFTMTATWVGGGYIAGTAETVYSSGLTWTQAPWCYSISLILGGIFFARKMRRFEFMTMLDPLESRFGKKMATVLYFPAILGELFWSAAILTALGTTFGVILGLSFSISIILSALIAIAYTVIGGLWAVAHTDILQLSIMFLGLFLVLPFAFSNTGGVGAVFSTYSEGMTGSLHLFPPIKGWEDPKWGNTYWQWWDSTFLLIFGGIPWQIYFQRVLSAKNEKAAMWLSITAGIFCALAALPPTLIGMIGYSANWSSFGASSPESASMILTYVFKYLTPDLVGAIALGGLAAAVMAAVAASLLSASGMAAWNVYRPIVKPNATQAQLDKVIKRSVIIIGTGATLIALNSESVYSLWYLSGDLVYCILFPQLVCALFFKGANWYGSLAGFIVSLVLRIGGGEPLLHLKALLSYPMIEDGVVMFPFRTFAMVGGLLTIFIVSYATRRICPPQPLQNLHRYIPVKK
ncbi:sodium:solute symporter family protein [Priestia aryabhattai]|uniref:sodium:solute symporter family protein n=1 Tax=Priestia aryabhattai TaxID=412384 RepID=UPI0015F5C21F|nr:sodium:solute symporter family protein [Priestia aryabhattai]